MEDINHLEVIGVDGKIVLKSRVRGYVLDSCGSG
jgi:hypothetical protein